MNVLAASLSLEINGRARSLASLTAFSKFLPSLPADHRVFSQRIFASAVGVPKGMPAALKATLLGGLVWSAARFTASVMHQRGAIV
jgi:hypothetical protein